MVKRGFKTAKEHHVESGDNTGIAHHLAFQKCPARQSGGAPGTAPVSQRGTRE
jgi:hypothetical protein